MRSVTEACGGCELNCSVMVRPKGNNQVTKAQKAIRWACGFQDQSPHPSYLNINISPSVTAAAPTTQKAVSPDPLHKYSLVCSGHKVQGEVILFLAVCVLYLSHYKVRHCPEMLLFPGKQPSSDPKTTRESRETTIQAVRL